MFAVISQQGTILCHPTTAVAVHFLVQASRTCITPWVVLRFTTTRILVFLLPQSPRAREMRQYFGDRNNGANSDSSRQQDDPSAEAAVPAAMPSMQEGQMVTTAADSPTAGTDGSSSDQQQGTKNPWRRNKDKILALGSAVLKVPTPMYLVTVPLPRRPQYT